VEQARGVIVERVVEQARGGSSWRRSWRARGAKLTRVCTCRGIAEYLPSICRGFAHALKLPSTCRTLAEYLHLHLICTLNAEYLLLRNATWFFATLQNAKCVFATLQKATLQIAKHSPSVAKNHMPMCQQLMCNYAMPNHRQLNGKIYHAKP